MTYYLYIFRRHDGGLARFDGYANVPAEKLTWRSHLYLEREEYNDIEEYQKRIDELREELQKW